MPALSLRVALTAAASTSAVLIAGFLLSDQGGAVLLESVGSLFYPWLPLWLIQQLVPALFTVGVAVVTSLAIYWLWTGGKA